LSEAQQVANLLNFCAVPMDPIAIPNLLERAFGSFLGAGKSIIDAIGGIAPGEVCACIGPGGFNSNVFNGGILGTIANNIEAINLGNLGQSIIDDIKNQVSMVGNSISSLINFENNIGGAYSQGGSQFSTPGCNSEVGVMHNSAGGGLAGNARIASTLQSVYDNLAGYPVQYQYNRNPAGGPLIGTELGEVKEYPNIFYLLLEPELIDLLDNIDDPTPRISNQNPVYDYCGNIIGYTANYTQRPIEKSEGDVPVVPVDRPGYQAGGLATNSNATVGAPTIAGSTTTGTADANVKYTKLQTTNSLVETVKFNNVIQQPAADKTWFFTIDALAGDAAGSTRRVFKVEGVVRNQSGTLSVVGANTTTLFGNTGNSWNVDAAVDSNIFKIRVYGQAATIIDWSLKLSIVEL
jgi:hypothetical protein